MEFEFGPVEDLAVVPDAFRPLYGKEKGNDGKYNVVAEYAPTVGAVVGLNKSLRAAREDAKKRPVVDLSPLSEYGNDVATIAEGFKKVRSELETQVATNSKINPEKLKQEFVQAHQGEITKMKTRNEALQGQLYKLLVENAGTAAALSEKGDAPLLMPFIKNQVKVIEEDGEFKVFVVDDSGDRRFSGTTGQPMTLKELVLEMKADKRYGKLFEPDAPSGGGTPPNGDRRPVRQNNGTVPKTANEKIAAGLAQRGKRHGSSTPPGM